MALGDPPRNLPADRPNLLLELAYTSLTRIVPRNQPHALNRELDILRSNAILLRLPRNQIFHSNIRLLLLRITRQLNDLHTIEQGPRNRIQLVRRADKQHLAQIERLIQIVVPERIVLLRIQRLQQRTRRIAPEIAAQLVDLIQHEHRVLHLNPLQVLNNLPRQRAYICPAMPAISASSCIPPSEILENFRSSARAIDRPSEVLPTPGGPTKQRIGPFISGFKRRTDR